MTSFFLVFLQQKRKTPFTGKSSFTVRHESHVPPFFCYCLDLKKYKLYLLIPEKEYIYHLQYNYIISDFVMEGMERPVTNFFLLLFDATYKPEACKEAQLLTDFGFI